MLPIAYVQTTAPKHRARNWCVYTPEGRAEIHKTLEKVNMKILHYLMENPVQGESVEFNDNRLALYCAQQGKCAISGRPLTIGDMHCHHKTRKSDGGDDRYTNLYWYAKTFISCSMQRGKRPLNSMQKRCRSILSKRTS